MTMKVSLSTFFDFFSKKKLSISNTCENVLFLISDGVFSEDFTSIIWHYQIAISNNKFVKLLCLIQVLIKLNQNTLKLPMKNQSVCLEDLHHFFRSVENQKISTQT